MNKFKYTKIGQMVDVLKSHAVNALVFSLLWMAFIMIWTNTVGSYVFAFIAIVSYFSASLDVVKERLKMIRNPMCREIRN